MLPSDTSAGRTTTTIARLLHRTAKGDSGVVWMSALHAVAGPDVLEQTARALEFQWTQHRHVPQDIRVQVGIAVAELVANIVEHGSAGRHLVQIDIQIAVEPGRVHISIRDDGNEPDVDFDAIGMPGDFAERGRGLAMAQGVLDGLAYQRQVGSNLWLLTSNPF